MKKQVLVLTAFVLSSLSGLALAEAGSPQAANPASLGKQSALEGVGKKVTEDTLKSVIPGDVSQGAKAAVETSENANAAKEAVQTAPAAIKEKAKDTAEKTVKDAMPKEANPTSATRSKNAAKRLIYRTRIAKVGTTRVSPG